MSNAGTPFPARNCHGKVGPRHLERVAVVYVRQSTMQQVSRHQESTRLQYGLVDRATALGWPASQVQVIDEDLGVSGASAEGRRGFQRLVADVGLDRVGIVLGIEISRLARSCRDWYQLLEVCAIFGTLIGDLDGVYDPGQYNDRLLLGLKGTMSEAELHVIKQRMLQGKLAKAQRGELGLPLPMGYVRRASGEVMKDPDEQAQATIALVFETFARVGTINGVLQHLVRHGVQLPVRAAHGPSKGELAWHRPNRVTLSNLLHSPIYAGAYVYGRRPTDPRRKKAGRPSTGRTVAPREQWQVLLPDRLPAYIGWEQYERNLRVLEENQATVRGTPRRGPSLLSGLVTCGRCGLRMAVQYSNNGYAHRYGCTRMAVDYGEPFCQSVKGEPLDQAVSELVLKALEPAALEVSLQVAADVEAERQRLRQHWEQRLERTHYESERAFRQFNAVEPENRLVARTLERRWEESIAAVEKLKQEYARAMASTPAALSPAERTTIRELARDFPALWTAPTTTTEDRQTILRQLVERVVVTVDGQSERTEVLVLWAGGHKTQTTLIRPVAKLEQLSYYSDLMQRVAALHRDGLPTKGIAARLNEEGWRPPKRRLSFNAPMVCALLNRLGHSAPPRRKASPLAERKRDEWTLTELARELDVPAVTLHSWVRKGILSARQDTGCRRQWLVRANKAELRRLRALRTAPRTWRRPQPSEES
jgi:DNA invertase Pin-like site-specific DNA recombinase